MIKIHKIFSSKNIENILEKELVGKSVRIITSKPIYQEVLRIKTLENKNYATHIEVILGELYNPNRRAYLHTNIRVGTHTKIDEVLIKRIFYDKVYIDEGYIFLLKAELENGMIIEQEYT